MYFVADINILTIGIDLEIGHFDALPAMVIRSNSGMEAIRHLRENHKIDTIVTRWDLPSMPNGQFVRKIRTARPSIPIVVILDDPDEKREIGVRKTGVTAVIPSTANIACVLNVIKHVLNIQDAVNKR